VNESPTTQPLSPHVHNAINTITPEQQPPPQYSLPLALLLCEATQCYQDNTSPVASTMTSKMSSYCASPQVNNFKTDLESLVGWGFLDDLPTVDFWSISAYWPGKQQQQHLQHLIEQLK